MFVTLDRSSLGIFWGIWEKTLKTLGTGAVCDIGLKLEQFVTPSNLRSSEILELRALKFANMHTVYIWRGYHQLRSIVALVTTGISRLAVIFTNLINARGWSHVPCRDSRSAVLRQKSLMESASIYRWSGSRGGSISRNSRSVPAMMFAISLSVQNVSDSHFNQAYRPRQRRLEWCIVSDTTNTVSIK